MEGKKKILIPQAVAEKGRQYLLDCGYELVEPDTTDSVILRKALKECSAVLLRTMSFEEELFQEAVNLRIIARHGVGYDNVDWKKAEKQGIYVTNTPFVTSVPVAEFTVGSMLLCARHMEACSQALRGGDFTYKNRCKGSTLEGKILGILGLGNIGREVAKRAYYGFGMEIKAYVPRPEGKTVPEYVRCVTKEELLATSDVITVHIPGTKENQKFLSREEFKQMKKTAYLIHVSRGGVVDETALAEAVKEGRIGGAAVDVFAKEPPDIKGKIFQTPGIFVTPHMASNTVECMEQMALTAAQEIHRVLTGKQPLYAVNRPERCCKKIQRGWNDS